jgi:hypothetical protein
MNALFRFLNSNFGVLISGAVISGLIVQYIEHKSLETTTKTALARATAAAAEHVSTQPPLEVHNPAQLRDLAASAARIFGWIRRKVRRRAKEVLQSNGRKPAVAPRAHLIKKFGLAPGASLRWNRAQLNLPRFVPITTGFLTESSWPLQCRIRRKINS